MWQDSWPISTFTLPCAFTLWDEGKPSYRCLCSQTEVLIKYCSRFLNLVRSSQSGVIHPNLASQIGQEGSLLATLPVWVLFNYFSAKSISLHLHFSSTNLRQNSWPIILSLLLFWTPSFCIWLSDEWCAAPQDQYFTLGHFSLHSNAFEHSEKSTIHSQLWKAEQSLGDSASSSYHFQWRI